MYCRQIEAVNATVLPRDSLKYRLNEEKDNTGIRFNEPATNFAIRQTMTNSSSSFSNTSSITTHKSSSSSSSSGSNTLYVWIDARYIHVVMYNMSGPRGTRLWFHTRCQTREVTITGHTKKESTPRIEPSTWDAQWVKYICLTTPLLTWLLSEWNVSISVYVRIETWGQNRKKQNSTRSRETTRARPRPPPAESGEASKAWHNKHTAHRLVDLISRSFTAQNLVFIWLLDCLNTSIHLFMCLYIYIAIFPKRCS